MNQCIYTNKANSMGKRIINKGINTEDVNRRTINKGDV